MARRGAHIDFGIEVFPDFNWNREYPRDWAWFAALKPATWRHRRASRVTVRGNDWQFCRALQNQFQRSIKECQMKMIPR